MTSLIDHKIVPEYLECKAAIVLVQPATGRVQGELDVFVNLFFAFLEI